MRILYVTTIGTTMGFFTSLIKKLIEEGHTVDIATNECDGAALIPEIYGELGCNVYQIPFVRSPVNRNNIKAVNVLYNILTKNDYNIVHCHTPVAAACTRFACRKTRDKGMRVFYTAHGFHFYKGAPLRNWLMFYPIEYICSYWTDCLITINQEDYRTAKRRFHARRTLYVPGVGIDLSRFDRAEDGHEIRDEFGIGDSFLLLSVGELNSNKNHEAVIKAIEGLKLKYIIVGKGKLEDYLRKMARTKKLDVHFAGFRSDVTSFYKAADAYILPSKREGLNVSLMEAMASGLPCLAGKIRGNVDLIDKEGGFLFNPNSVSEIRTAIQMVMHENTKMGEYNKQKVRKYDINNINALMLDIYTSFLQ